MVQPNNNSQGPVVNDDDDVLRRKKPHFPEPCIRTTNFERDDFGIVSPSDLRRPRESSYVKVADKVVDNAPPPEPDTLVTTSKSSGTALPESTPSVSIELKKEPKHLPKYADKNKESNVESLKQGAAARESAFIDEFLAIKSQRPEAISNNETSETSWRQTALQRRASSAGSASAKTTSVFKSTSERETDEAWRTVPKNFATPPSDAAYKVSLLPEKAVDIDLFPEYERTESNEHTTSANTEVQGPDRQAQREAAMSKEHDSESVSSPIPRSTSEKLSVLPNDDIDFLSAADIRASMAGKRASIKNDIEKPAKREALEKEFIGMERNYKDIDPMIESKTINDRLIRRTERRLQQLQENSKTTHTESESPTNPTTSEPYQSESSIDRLKRWLEESSATLSKHFWQDPVPEGASELAASKAYLDKIIARIQKGRSATAHVAEDLKRDIPACKKLLERLEDDEEMLDHSTSVLRRRMMEASMQVSTPLNLKEMQTNDWKYKGTELELSAAHNLLSEIERTRDTTNVGELFRRRLRLAASVCHRNAKLTRSLIWSLQGRLGDDKVSSQVHAYYRVIAHRLLTLRDTQLALVQLVDRAMQIYKVTPKPLEEDVGALTHSRAISEEQAWHHSVEGHAPNPTSNVTSDTHLANEIQAQKSAVRGLPKGTFDESGPLAHSLFRPFSLQLESLGKETDVDAEAEQLKEDARRELGESKLADEIRKVYEDVYGPITADHRQVPDVLDEVQGEENKEEAVLQISRDDPVIASTEHVAELSSPPLEPVASLDAAPQEQRPATEVSSEVQGDDASNISTTPSENTKATETSTFSLPSETSSSAVTAESSHSDIEPATPSLVDLPTHYTILILDAKTDTLTITTSTTPPPRDPSPTIPIHHALSTLDSPAKFIPHITPDFEITTAKRDMLILRNRIAETPPFSMTSTPAATETTEAKPTKRHDMNPIDGTTRLSPTGYVGVEDVGQLEREFQERRMAARKMAREQEEGRRSRKRGAGGGVVKTAIWAAAGCYVVGVLGEVFR